MWIVLNTIEFHIPLMEVAMKSLLVPLIIATIVSCGCYRSERRAESSTAERVELETAKSADPHEPMQSSDKKQVYNQISLRNADQAQVRSEAIDRKIIKDAEVTLEVNSPVEAQRNVTAIAGNRGGFVVTSESKQRDSADPNRPELDITLIIRVPAAQFEVALQEIRRLGNRTLSIKETGQDVTEEFIDLEARIKTQKALEAQFLEIMKQASKVADALEVQRQIAEVRTEIERLEGRKRFLENRASLSNITVNLKSPVLIVTTSGFWANVKDAWSDSLAVASGIVLFLVRFSIIMIPVVLLILAPCGLVVRYVMRRTKRLQLARQLRTEP